MNDADNPETVARKRLRFHLTSTRSLHFSTLRVPTNANQNMDMVHRGSRQATCIRLLAHTFKDLFTAQACFVCIPSLRVRDRMLRLGDKSNTILPLLHPSACVPTLSQRVTLHRNSKECVWQDCLRKQNIMFRDSLGTRISSMIQ